jgi:hypothetical protein
MTLAEARDLLAGSAIARAAFGDDVVDHYVHAADIEIAAFNAAVTDWERVRGFERSSSRDPGTPTERKHLMSTTHDVINPATEEVVTTLDLVGVEETDAAIAKAVAVGPQLAGGEPGGSRAAAAPLRRCRRGAHRGTRDASR